MKQSFVKLNPRTMVMNPIMFTVEIVTLIMLVVTLLSIGTEQYGSFGYNLLVFVILFLTLLFANFAEAIAEARGKHRRTVCVGHVKRLLRSWWQVQNSKR